MGSRKIFAIREGVKRKLSYKHVSISDSDTDDDFQPPAKKQPSNAHIAQVLSQVKEIRQELNILFHLSKQTKLPPGLSRHLIETFRCHICQAVPMKPPIIFTRCCRRLVGCQVCVDGWYNGDHRMERSCPLCRHERAYAETTTVRGFDEFLQAIAPLLTTEEAEEETDFD